MENNFQQYHRVNYQGNGSERRPNPLPECEEPHVPNLILRESELLYVNDPEKLLSDYMKIRN
jgi:hypothetical protein